MQPDLELVQVGGDQSCEIWSHGYPYRTVRWHLHPEYELHVVTATEGNRYVGDHVGPFGPGGLVLVGPNLPHKRIGDVPAGFVAGATAAFPELRFLHALPDASFRGVRFAPLASIGFRPDPSAYLSTTMSLVLQHIDRGFAGDLNETALAALARQGVSAFSRPFRRRTGMTFVQYVNSLRIELACQHLGQGDLSVAEIRFEVGFNDVSKFSRQFSAAMGMPPSKFRILRRSGARPASAAA